MVNGFSCWVPGLSNSKSAVISAIQACIASGSLYSVFQLIFFGQGSCNFFRGVTQSRSTWLTTATALNVKLGGWVWEWGVLKNVWHLIPQNDFWYYGSCVIQFVYILKNTWQKWTTNVVFVFTSNTASSLFLHPAV